MLFVLDCHAFALVPKCLLDAIASVELYMTLIDSVSQKVITHYVLYHVLIMDSHQLLILDLFE